MLSISSLYLTEYLESEYDYKIIGLVDIDLLLQRPRKTLYELFKQWHKPAFSPKERIVLFSRKPLSIDTLVHIQKCASLIDISNFFILLCSSSIDQEHLESVKNSYSTDDCVFSTLAVDIVDTLPTGTKNPLILLPQSFCFSPWAHLEISSQGEFKPCCVYRESIKDSDGRVFNINDDSIETVYTSHYLTDLRKQFINGERPSGCSHCWLAEQHNVKSNRHWTTSYLGVAAQTLQIEQDSIDNIISLDIKLGNLCNFKCRICTPGYSSRIAEEQANHFKTVIDLKTLNQKGQWVNHSEIWKMLGTLGSQLINIDFYGGEPFLIKQHEVFLNYLIDQNHASKIRLHYNSNGSVYPSHLFEKWKCFKQVDIAFSIDNIGQRFELERGGDWQKVQQNLDQFLASKLPNMELNVFTTINVQNVYYLEELIDWFETKNFNSLFFNLLERPKFLSISSMNDELSRAIIDRLCLIGQTKIEKYNLNTFIEMIKQNKNSSDMIDELREYMLKLDNIRNQNFKHTHSEIANIIYRGNYHEQTV